MSEQVNGALRYRLERLERDMHELEGEMRIAIEKVNQKLDRIQLAIVTGALAISGSLIAVALTILSQRN